MPRKEHYQKILKCPSCEKEGVAYFEENETPPHHGGKLSTELESISGRFYASKNDRGNYEIKCKDCDVIIP